MIVGRIDPIAWRPFIDGYIEIPSLKVSGFVQFLMDTGSDDTVLMPADAQRLKVDYTAITKTDESIGSAGASLDYIARAIVIIQEPDTATHLYEIDLRLPAYDPKKPELMIPPSLIGRDILSRWRITFDGHRSVTAEVISSDRKFPWGGKGP